MLSTGLVAIDATILAAAVPAVVRDLGGLSQFPWLFSVYLLAQAVSVPIYGKVADLVGRKPVMLLGVALFLAGSLLCGLSWSMGSLIAFRALQGLGAGAVQPVGMTIVGDIYSVAERATVQGYIAAVWAISSLVGPTLGGVFADYASWRWIFLVNLPLGAARGMDAVAPVRGAAAGPRPRARRGPRSTCSARCCMLVGTVALLVALLEGGVLWAWASPVSIGLLVGSVLVLVAFVLVERRAAEPVLPLWVFRHRVVGAAMATSLVVGVLLLGLTSYVPLFAQGVLGTGAIVAGFALAAMTIGWPIAAATSGRLYLRFGFRTTMLIGSVIALAGAALLLTVDAVELGAAPRGPQLRHGPRLRLRREPRDRRGPVVGRLGAARGGHRRDALRPLGGLGRRGGRVRRASPTPSSATGSGRSRPAWRRCRRGCSTRRSTRCSSRRSSWR